MKKRVAKAPNQLGKSGIRTPTPSKTHIFIVKHPILNQRFRGDGETRRPMCIARVGLLCPFINVLMQSCSGQFRYRSNLTLKFGNFQNVVKKYKKPCGELNPGCLGECLLSYPLDQREILRFYVRVYNLIYK